MHRAEDNRLPPEIDNLSFNPFHQRLKWNGGVEYMRKSGSSRSRLVAGQRPARRVRKMSPKLTAHNRLQPRFPADNTIRVELVMRIRQEIALGIYETPAKLESALATLFGTLDD